jgi:hypothetical protein
MLKLKPWLQNERDYKAIEGVLPRAAERTHTRLSFPRPSQ